MIRFAFIAIMLACSFGVASVRAADVAHYKAKGDLASAAWGDSNGRIVIAAQRIDSSTTFLNIQSLTCDSVVTLTCSGYSGFGTIPGGNLSVNGSGASLSTNLANDPDFTLVSFVFDLDGSNYTETPVTGGTIIISFRQNGFSSTSLKGLLSETSAGVTLKQNTDRTSSSASAASSFLGMPIPASAIGEIGTNRSNLIIVSKP